MSRSTHPSKETVALRAHILQNLRKGDQARIAEAVGTVPEYVKQVMRYRPKAQSPLALRIWKVAEQLLKDRAELSGKTSGLIGRRDEQDTVLRADHERHVMEMHCRHVEEQEACYREIEAENFRLRQAVREQATVYATILNAIIRA